MNLSKEELVKEISFKTSRSGGKGGQNVNKVSTKVALIFNVPHSALFTDTEKQQLLTRLATKLDAQGNIQVVSQKDRSQLANKEDAILKTMQLLKAALHQQKARKSTKIPKSAIAKRRRDKLAVAVRKETRKKPQSE